MPRDRLDMVLPADLAQQLAAYATREGLNRSSAARILIRTALKEPPKSAAIREGLALGVSMVKSKLGTMVADAIAELGL